MGGTRGIPSSTERHHGRENLTGARGCSWKDWPASQPGEERALCSSPYSPHTPTSSTRARKTPARDVPGRRHWGFAFVDVEIDTPLAWDRAVVVEEGGCRV